MSFTAHPGTHLLEVFAIGLQFPQYRVEVGPKNGGRARVSPVENKRLVLKDPLVLQPIVKDIEYYEVRPPAPRARSRWTAVAPALTRATAPPCARARDRRRLACRNRRTSRWDGS